MATIHANGGAIPSNRELSQLANPSVLDTAAIREMLGLMKGSLGTMCVILRLPQFSLAGAGENGGRGVRISLRLTKN